MSAVADESKVHVECPRCVPADSNDGYISWATATVAERDGHEADADGEVPCPLCHEEGSVTEEVAEQFKRSRAPKPRFELTWLDQDTAEVYAANEQTPVVGELFWNGNEWLFIPHDKEGEQVMDLRYIPCDPDGEKAEREDEQRIAIQQPEGIRAALMAELNGRRQLRRDDTRELAVVGAKIEARKWWATEFIHLSL